MVAQLVSLRTVLGDALRETRLRQQRTLREVSLAARVSLGYLSEVERGQKEASSELLASICAALGVRVADLLRGVSEELAEVEPYPMPVAVPALEAVPDDSPADERRPVTSAASAASAASRARAGVAADVVAAA